MITVYRLRLRLLPFVDVVSCLGNILKSRTLAERKVNLLIYEQEFSMDPEFAREIESQKEEKISMLNKEMAWNEEKLKISLDKLRLR